jgi:hypothetical protein
MIGAHRAMKSALQATGNVRSSKTGFHNALIDAVRTIGTASTPHELEVRGVQRVRCVSTEQVSKLIESAVERTLRERALGEIDAGEIGVLVNHAQLGLLGMLQGFQDVEDSRGAIRAQRRELQADLDLLRNDRNLPVDRDEHVERLERRIAKLMRSLAETEAVLQRVAAMKNLDLGIASLYRVVQGLSDDPRLDDKRSMMKRIFEANVVLQQKRALAAV